MDLCGEFSNRICVFCSDALYVKGYACHSFVYMKGTAMEQPCTQEWMACSICGSLIDNERWEKLTDRAAQIFIKRHRLEASEIPFVRERLDRLHQTFRLHIIPES